MKAAQINGYGGEEVVQVTDDAAKPAAGTGQALIEVQAAGINPFDLKVREGYVRQMVELNLPATLGGDVAGTVVGLGEGIANFKVGQTVFGQAGALSSQGSFAEYTPVKASQLAVKPVSIDFISAAALPLAGVSAYQALVDHMNLQRDQKILIHGGAGGIGSFAIQLAKYLGAYVASTASANDRQFVENLGADEVIDYQTQDFSNILKDYDAVFDTIGGETNIKSYKILKTGGALVSMVEKPNETLVNQGNVRYISQSTEVTTLRLTKIAELVDSGKIKIHIAKIFSLNDAAKALEYLKTAHPRGKVVLQVKN